MRLVGGRLKGGVGIQTIIVAVILAAMSGIIGGEIVLLGLIALPQMLRLGYDRDLAIGVVCAGGALGTMVPPSIVLIIYGLAANVSIGELFLSAFIPGFMLAGFYALYVIARGYLTPGAAPALEGEDVPTAEKLRLLKGLILPILVVAAVMGSIYGGIASVTEASAVGVMGVLISTLIRGELSFGLVKEASMRTLQTVGMIVWIGIGASAIVGVFNLMGGIDFVSGLLTGLSENRYVVLLTMMGILFVLGMFLDDGRICLTNNAAERALRGRGPWPDVMALRRLRARRRSRRLYVFPDRHRENERHRSPGLAGRCSRPASRQGRFPRAGPVAMELATHRASPSSLTAAYAGCLPSFGNRWPLNGSRRGVTGAPPGGNCPATFGSGPAYCLI